MIQVVILSGQVSLERPLGATLGSNIQVKVISDASAVRQRIREGRADVIIVDLDTRFSRLEDQFAFIAELQDPDLPVLVLTDDDRRSTALDLLQRGVYDYLRKPPSPMEMAIVIRRAHEHAVLKRELNEMKRKYVEASSCDSLIGSSTGMRVVYDLIHRVANLNTPTLITGESGTGKELVARAIHNLGCRRDAPFVAVSCGAIPETLIEAELFGHEKGAFTGASTSRRGMLESAGEGTLFLDEIGELSQLTQVKLLRVLQQREFTPLGGNRSIPLQARLLLATHRNLEEMVAEKQFRQDLFFRINVMNIKLPALRDRSEDIPALANHFLQNYAEGCRKAVVQIEPHAMRALLSHSWPGNIRELENTIHRGVILTDTDTIRLEDLPDLTPSSSGTEVTQMPFSYDGVLQDFKRSFALQTLAECNGNKTRAASTLKISRAYLHRLLRPVAHKEAS